MGNLAYRDNFDPTEQVDAEEMISQIIASKAEEQGWMIVA